MILKCSRCIGAMFSFSSGFNLQSHSHRSVVTLVTTFQRLRRCLSGVHEGPNLAITARHRIKTFYSNYATSGVKKIKERMLFLLLKWFPAETLPQWRFLFTYQSHYGPNPLQIRKMALHTLWLNTGVCKGGKNVVWLYYPSLQGRLKVIWGPNYLKGPPIIWMGTLG